MLCRRQYISLETTEDLKEGRQENSVVWGCGSLTGLFSAADGRWWTSPEPTDTSTAGWRGRISVDVSLVGQMPCAVLARERQEQSMGRDRKQGVWWVAFILFVCR
jgi:hypothetical protein